MAISFTLNGKSQAVEVDPQMPLLWVLRDPLHINGEATRSCITPISAVSGKQVTTIEGLSADGNHPVQQAWVEIDVQQCGYCQAGQMMSAAALLAKTPKPNDQEIDAAMNGNICRCGTYIRIRQATHMAANLATSQPTRGAHSTSSGSAAGQE